MLRPFFRHPGSKWMLSARIPQPRHELIIEPFAGGAGYACRYGAGKEVHLFDADSSVIDLWQWLIAAQPADVLALPVDFGDTDIRALGLGPQPTQLIQRWLVPQGGTTNWRMPPSGQKQVKKHPGSLWSARTRARIAKQLPAIHKWTATCCDYLALNTHTEATWLVDPPYEANDSARAKYKCDNVTDYAQLGAWCQHLRGQVIVHEQEGAQWLPFKTLNKRARTGRTKGGRMKSAHEVYWTNDLA